MMTPFFAFGMPGGPEWILIFLVLLLLFGAKKLPELARGIGRSLGEFRKAKDDFEKEITESETVSKREEEAKKKPSPPATAVDTDNIQDAEEVEEPDKDDTD